MVQKQIAYVKATLLFIAAFSIYFFSNTRSTNTDWKLIVQYDAMGYYTYLPSIFIYHDIEAQYTVDTVEYAHLKTYSVMHKAGNGYVNKYSAGPALLCLPFFAAAHGFALLHPNFDADGYDVPYMVSVELAAIFYAVMGLWLLAKILRLFNVREVPIALTLLVVFFGTNLMVYTLVEPGMSHVYSFFATAGFVYYFLLWIKQYQLRHLLLAALFMGLGILIRQLNILVVLSVPFLCGNFATLKQAFQYLVKKPKQLILALAICFAVLFIQLAIYKLQTGLWYVYSYGGETFFFTKSQIGNMLFSFKKGVFLYTPVLLLNVLLSFYVFRKNWYQLFTYHAFFWFIIYVLASWWSWWYGGGFSIRPIIDFLPIFLLPIALALNTLKPVLKGVYIGVLVALVALCQLQTYQYRHAILHWSDTTKEDYIKNFWRIDNYSQ